MVDEIITATDFTANALADLGVTVSRTPVTLTFTGNGDEINEDGTPEDITAILHRKRPEFEQKEEGLLNTIVGYIMVAPDQELNRNDKISYQGEIFRVINPITRGPAGSIGVYTYSDIELIE